MGARKHRCRIQLGASEPVAYRLVPISAVLFFTETVFGGLGLGLGLEGAGLGLGLGTLVLTTRLFN